MDICSRAYVEELVASIRFVGDFAGMKIGWTLPLALCFPACAPTSALDLEDARQRMVAEQIAARGIANPKVLAAMRDVPRHEFIPAAVRSAAYDDGALPIGYEQTISQPYIVALMTEQLAPKPTDRVLEIGTGSGYQAAVLAKIVKEVFSIEIVEALGQRAAADLARLGFNNVRVKTGDGYAGWPEFAPFDAIIVTCAPDHIPEPLVVQLKEGGRMIIPVGDRAGQTLHLLEKRGVKIVERAVLPVRFVKMTGKAELPR